jgi:hypothetical protein
MCLHLQPRRRRLYPLAHCLRRFQPHQLTVYHGWNGHRFEQSGKNFNVPDQDQVMNWPGVGDGAHRKLEPKAAQILALTLKIVHRWQILNHRMSLEESVELVAS